MNSDDPRYGNVAGGEWSQAKFWGFIRSNLRKASMKWPPIQQAALAARRPSQSANKRLKWQYQCANCGEWHPRSNVHVDHIEPAGSLKCWADLEPFARRLFCEAEGLQVLCKTCHGLHRARTRANA